jgi:hypothetical protein
MRWATDETGEFEEWFETLAKAEQKSIDVALRKLELVGPGGGRPLIDTVAGSRHSNIKELRVTQTLRVFFAFDPRRVGILLIGGDKAGQTKRFYRQMVAKADRIYDAHLRSLRKGAPRNGW